MFNIGIFILGITMTSMITGSITSMLANSDVSSTQRREKIYRIRKYMQSYRVPDDLADTIRGYYEYLWETNHRDEAKIAEMIGERLSSGIWRFAESTTFGAAIGSIPSAQRR